MKKKIWILATLGLLLALWIPASKGTAAIYGKEYRAVWLAYYDFEEWYSNSQTHSEEDFTLYFRNVLKEAKNRNFNHIIVHVRPFGDALYKSKYFPSSACVVGQQGAPMLFDPLKIMVKEAHLQKIKIEAWINPYRVSNQASYAALSKDNIARIWHKDPNKRRNVLSYGGKLYFNPSQKEVRQLIINGVKEIIRKYDVDGIHMDDYFYPAFSASNYKKAFDAKEYNASAEKRKGMSIVDYRRKQVNILVKRIKYAVKTIKPKLTFGISPAGDISALTSPYNLYVDIYKWMKSRDYVDYICPQIYWAFSHSYTPYAQSVKKWMAIPRNKKVKLYIGLAAYKCGIGDSYCPGSNPEWMEKTVLSKMIRYGRKKGVDGFAVFDYMDLTREEAKAAVRRMGLEFAK